MTNLAAVPALTEKKMTRQELHKIASTLFASAIATQHHANSLAEDDDDRHAIADQACAERALYIRFCESHGLRPAHLDFAGCD